MKKITLLLFGLSFTLLQAQLPVSQEPENKNAVIEEFTGMHCVFCPDGHRISQQIYDNNPADVVLINIHTGSYANPSNGEPDFRTNYGSAIAFQSHLAGYPAGTVSRHYFGYSQNGSPSGATALGRGQWSGAANEILTQESYCNIALEATVDIQTREMTVDIEIYFTADSPVEENFLNVALLQNNVEGPQVGSSSNPDQVLPNGNYNHMHMLRDLLTGQWGQLLSGNTQGTLIQTQLTYTLPEEIRDVPLDYTNIDVVGFVTEGQQEIITGSMAVINYSGLVYDTNVSITDQFYTDDICAPAELEPQIKVFNNGNNAISSISFEYTINDGTPQEYTWEGSLSSLGTEIIDIPVSDFTLEDTNTMNIEITAVDGNEGDEDLSDNNATITFNKTTNEGHGVDYIVTIVQDAYGSESLWAIVDENENIIANGGPYSNLSSAGTETHTHEITIDQSGCYKFYMLDTYGDGMNSGYGAGNYSLSQANGVLVLYGNGIFENEDVQSFSIDTTVGIDNVLGEEIELSPNPSHGNIILKNVKDMSVKVYNAEGQEVFSKNQLNGMENLNLSHLTPGVYFAHFNKNNQSGIKKIIITE